MHNLRFWGLVVLSVVWAAACTQLTSSKGSPPSIPSPSAPKELPPRGSLEYLDAESQVGVLAFGTKPPDGLQPTGGKILGVPVYARTAASETAPEEAVTTYAYDPRWGLVAISQVFPADACDALFQKMYNDYGPPTEGEWPADPAVEWKGKVTTLRLERKDSDTGEICATARVWRHWLDREPSVPPVYLP